jgi:hypothetical protein
MQTRLTRWPPDLYQVSVSLLLLLGGPITNHTLGHPMPGSRAKGGENLHINHFGWLELEERRDFVSGQNRQTTIHSIHH